MPPNGLVVYCGTIVTEEGKEKKVNIDFEPFKPINTSLYLCDNKFHTEVSPFSHLVYLCNLVLSWNLGLVFTYCDVLINSSFSSINKGIDSPALGWQ